MKSFFNQLDVFVIVILLMITGAISAPVTLFFLPGVFNQGTAALLGKRQIAAFEITEKRVISRVQSGREDFTICKTVDGLTIVVTHGGADGTWMLPDGRYVKSDEFTGYLEFEFSHVCPDVVKAVIDNKLQIWSCNLQAMKSRYAGKTTAVGVNYVNYSALGNWLFINN